VVACGVTFGGGNDLKDTIRGDGVKVEERKRKVASCWGVA